MDDDPKAQGADPPATRFFKSRVGSIPFVYFLREDGWQCYTVGGKQLRSGQGNIPEAILTHRFAIEWERERFQTFASDFPDDGQEWLERFNDIFKKTGEESNI